MVNGENTVLMTPRERITRTLHGQKCDRIAIHARIRMVPEGLAGDWIRNMGWGIFGGGPIFKVSYAGIGTEEKVFEKGDKHFISRIYHTSKGTVEMVSQVYHYGGMFIIEHLFKDEKDYDAILEVIKAMEFIPCYEEYLKGKQSLGESGYPWMTIGYTPMHEIMVKMMGVETFCYEWADNRERVLELYEALTCQHKIMYDIAADSPAETISYGGNVQANIVSPQMFREYYIPCYNELAMKLHKKCKLLATHWDGPFGVLKDLIKETQFDILDAFCPPPDGDITIAEARRLWPEIIISMNFPSGLQHLSEEKIEEATRMFIEEAGSGEKFMISLTEDFPDEYIRKIFTGIAKAVQRS